jgi:CHRD domain
MIQNNKLLMIVLFTSVLSVGSVSVLLSTVKAQEGRSFSATLSGSDEVPPTESNSTGTAKFQVNENNSRVSYWVNITGIKKVNQAHIHNGTAGENGDIVATLSKGKSAKGDERPPQIGFAGNITKDDLQGPLKGKEISDLVNLMSDGGAYANVHTDKYPKGAIRGQIASTSGSMEAGTSANTTSTSGSMEAGNTTPAQSTSEMSQSADSPDMDVDESMK